MRPSTRLCCHVLAALLLINQACNRKSDTPEPTNSRRVEHVQRAPDAADPPHRIDGIAGAKQAPSPTPDRKMPVRSAKVMGTVVSVTIYGDDEVAAAKAISAVFAEFRRIERLMTTWLDTSAVSKINAAAGNAAVGVDAETFAVVSAAQSVSVKTRGAFDISVGAFKGLWKFDHDHDGTIPKTTEVQRRLPHVGYQHIKLDTKRRTIKLNKAGMRITLGGIAKGYAVDRAVALLHQRGFVDFILQAGGDLFVSGKKGAESWQVGIRDPRGTETAFFARAKIKDRTFSTSGDYERFIIKNGIRYHHILNPRTGYPAKRCRSATVMAPSAMVADAWSTALFVLGPEGMKLVEADPQLEAVMISADNQVLVSSGLKQRLHRFRSPTDGV